MKKQLPCLAFLCVTVLLVSVFPAAGMSQQAEQSTQNQSLDTNAPCGDYSTINQSVKSCLVNSYSPIIHFTDDENYRPTSIGAFVNRSTVGITNEDVTLNDLQNEEDDLEIDSERLTYPDSDLPQVVYASVRPNVEFSPPETYTTENYVAVTYWMFYVHDDKAVFRDSYGNQRLETIEIAEHQSDFESVTIFINSSGPQWVGGSQHLGGELRPWTAVQTRNETHPHIYVAEGAHSVYFTNSESYGSTGMLGQDYHLDNASISTQVPVFGGVMSMSPGGARESIGVYSDVTGNDSTWSQESEEATSYNTEQYEVRRLTGDEPWQEYEGSFIDSILKSAFIGDAEPPAQRNRWKSPGDWMENQLVPYETQVEPKLGWQLQGINKGSFNQSRAKINVKVRNAGAQPGTIYTRVTITDSTGELLGRDVQAHRREAGTSILDGKETLHVILESEPSDQIKIEVEVFREEPDSNSDPVSKLSTKMCSPRYKCIL